jgi:hypothetical protein
VPGQEALLRIVMRACAAVGDRKGVEDAYQIAVASVEETSGLCGEVQRQTEQRPTFSA